MNAADKVLDWFEGGKNWIQGSMYDVADSVAIMPSKGCLLGGIDAARVALISLPGKSKSFFQLEALLEIIIAEQFPDRINNYRLHLCQVAQFNDHLDTTWEDVEMVLQKASTRIDEMVVTT